MDIFQTKLKHSKFEDLQNFVNNELQLDVFETRNATAANLLSMIPV